MESKAKRRAEDGPTRERDPLAWLEPEQVGALWDARATPPPTRRRRRRAPAIRGDAAEALRFARSCRRLSRWLLVALALGCADAALGRGLALLEARQARAEVEGPLQAIHQAQRAFERRSGRWAGTADAFAGQLSPELLSRARVLSAGDGYLAEVCGAAGCALIDESGVIRWAQAEPWPSGLSDNEDVPRDKEDG